MLPAIGAPCAEPLRFQRGPVTSARHTRGDQPAALNSRHRVQTRTPSLPGAATASLAAILPVPPVLQQ